MSDPIYRAPADSRKEPTDIPLDDPNAIEPVTPPPQEPLFNKKAMILWALGAFIVWFMVTRTVPLAKHAAREAVIQRIEDAEKNSAGRIRIERKNGKIVRIIQTEPGAAAPTAATPPSGTTSPASPEPAAQPEAPAKR